MADEAVNPCEDKAGSDRTGGEEKAAEKTAHEQEYERELKMLSEAHRYPWCNYYHPYNHAQTDHFDDEMIAALTPRAWLDFRRKCTPPDKHQGKG